MAWRETDWHFITSQGGEITLGPSFQVGATGGSFFLENKRTHNRIELAYGAFGVGTGAGIPFGISGATRDTPSGGIGNILTKDRPRPYPASLYPEDFAGLFVMGNLQYSGAFEGQSVSAIFFNIPPIEMIFGATGFGMAANALTNAASLGTFHPLLDSAKAMGMIWADSKGLEIGSAGAMYYYGYLSRA